MRFSASCGSLDSLETVVLKDSDTGARIEVVPGIGSNLIRYEVDGLDVILTPPDESSLREKPTGFGFPVLVPPNRIEGASFRADGRTYRFPANRGNMHIHGVVADVPWQVASMEPGEEKSVLRTQLRSVQNPSVASVFPQDFTLTMVFELSPNGVGIEFTCANDAEERLPFGLGFHPYFRAPMTPGGSRSDCLIQLDARARWILRDCLPTGEWEEPYGAFDLREEQRLGVLDLDDLYEVNSPSLSRMIDRHSGAQLDFEADETFPFWVVWTGPSREAPFVCLEPYTCVTNAFNLKLPMRITGARMIEPGSSFVGRLHISAGRYSALRG